MSRSSTTLALVALLILLAACRSTTGPSPLAAQGGPDREVAVGTNVVLDGDASIGQITSFSWSFTAVPDGSQADLQDAHSARASFIADRPGQYVATLTVSDSRSSETDSVVITAVAKEGIRLDGLPEALAAETTFDFMVPLSLNPANVERDPVTGSNVLRTEIAVLFEADASVEDVNRLLTEVRGTIVAMTRNATVLIIEVPDPGDLVALDELLARVLDHGKVADAWSTSLVEPPQEPVAGDAALGTLATPDVANAAALVHHYAVRAHAAWNASAAIGEAPWLLIADFFGDGEPNADFAVDSTGTDYATGNAHEHGYHVLGIIAGTHDEAPTTDDRGDVTGIFPETLRVRAIDMQNGATLLRVLKRLVHVMNEIVAVDADARIVINTSIGFADPPNVSTAAKNRLASIYVILVGINNLKDHFVHATSAGNTGCLTVVAAGKTCPKGDVEWWPAVGNSAFTYAALADLVPVLGLKLAPLDNILVVENRATRVPTGLSRPVPTCASYVSQTGGNISAIGTGVLSHTGAAAGTASKNGTSMSTPQVAGLAAFVWSLAPSLSGAQVAELLRDTARSDYAEVDPGNSAYGDCNPEGPQPVIDALAAVLAGGGTAALSAMLDVDDSGTFDADDIEEILAAHSAAATLDYSRFDLNGDGFTDGAANSTNRDRFDLDGDRSHGTVTRSYAGVELQFNEAAMTDRDVLCAAAFSSAYSGSVLQRNRLLGQHCGLLDLVILDPTSTSSYLEGENIALVVDVTLNGPQSGELVLLAGGVERDRQAFQQGSYTPVTTLSTRHLCRDNRTLEVIFEDAATGLRAVDTVEPMVRPNFFSVAIGGPNPRDYLVYRTGGGDPEIADVRLTGRARFPSCTDPFSSAVDQDILRWSGPGWNENLGAGPDLTIEGSQLWDEDVGEFTSRTVELTAALDGDDGFDSVRLQPCTTSIGLGDNRFPVAGYPECSPGTVMGLIYERLHELFGTIDPSDIDRIIHFHIHGLDAHRAVLESLDIAPCDPRRCDPFPPGFPQAHEVLRDGAYGDRSLAFSTHLTTLFEYLESGTDASFQVSVTDLGIAVASDASLGDQERVLLAQVLAVARATAQFFAPPELGGEGAWSRFGIAGDPEQVHSQVDTLAPALKAVEGLMTAVVVMKERSEFDQSLFHDAATYAAALEALDQVSRLAGSP